MGPFFLFLLFSFFHLSFHSCLEIEKLFLRRIDNFTQQCSFSYHSIPKSYFRQNAAGNDNSNNEPRKKWHEASFQVLHIPFFVRKTLTSIAFSSITQMLVQHVRQIWYMVSQLECWCSLIIWQLMLVESM